MYHVVSLQPLVLDKGIKHFSSPLWNGMMSEVVYNKLIRHTFKMLKSEL
jgi:hypothetical protein